MTPSRLPLSVRALEHRLGYPSGDLPAAIHGRNRLTEVLADAELSVLAIDKRTAYAWHIAAPLDAIALILDVSERELSGPTPLGVSLHIAERERARSLLI
jgi:hypothetical protein